MLIRLLFITLVFLCVIAAFLYFQEKLIYYPVAADNPRYSRFAHQQVWFETENAKLQGWHFTIDGHTSKALLYFGGNAEDITVNFSDVANFGVKHVFLVNYRGYGLSTGTPSQRHLYQDGLAVFDQLTATFNIQSEDIIVFGRSLGSGVATYIAAHRPVHSVILVTPFDSIANVAASKFPLLPIKGFIRHPFPSIEFAPRIKAPALMIVAEQDTVIPPAHAKALFEAWHGPKQFELLASVGHNDIGDHPRYYSLIKAFSAR